MLTPQLPEIFERFRTLRVVVLGDVMIDSYLWGDVKRISPEAPVPVVSVTQTENRLGGAANVALNVAALGAEVHVCAVVGNDDKTALLEDCFAQSGLDPGALVRSDERPTTVKTRIISDGQHLLRVDQENTHLLSDNESAKLLARLEQLLNDVEPHVLIMQDYNKGVLTEKVIESTTEMCRIRNIPTAVDPKKDQFLSYRGVDLFKPNLKELREGLNLPLDTDFEVSLRNAMRTLHDNLGNRISLVTLSERGVAITESNRFEHLPAHDRKIIDVSGAGDTVISVAALCLALNLDLRIIAALSNLAGGLVCEQVGVVPIDADHLYNEACLLHPAR